MKAIKIISIIGICTGAGVALYGWYSVNIREDLPMDKTNKRMYAGFVGAGVAAVSAIGLIITRKA